LRCSVRRPSSVDFAVSCCCFALRDVAHQIDVGVACDALELWVIGHRLDVDRAVFTDVLVPVVLRDRRALVRGLLLLLHVRLLPADREQLRDLRHHVGRLALKTDELAHHTPPGRPEATGMGLLSWLISQ
jgi:hypothetical protein